MTKMEVLLTFIPLFRFSSFLSRASQFLGTGLVPFSLYALPPGGVREVSHALDVRVK